MALKRDRIRIDGVLYEAVGDAKTIKGIQDMIEAVDDAYNEYIEASGEMFHKLTELKAGLIKLRGFEGEIVRLARENGQTNANDCVKDTLKWVDELAGELDTASIDKAMTELEAMIVDLNDISELIEND